MGSAGRLLVQGGALERLRNFRYRTAWLIGSLLVIFVLCPALASIQASGMEVWLVPTLQGVAIVSFIFWLLSGAGGIVRNVLESWPAVQLGLLSYSLYIWQQPFTQWSGLPSFPSRLTFCCLLSSRSYATGWWKCRFAAASACGSPRVRPRIRELMTSHLARPR